MEQEKQIVVSNNIVSPVISVDEAIKGFKTFEEIKNKVLGKNDKCMISGKSYINKSGWRKIKTIFNISEEIIDSKRVVFANKIVWMFKVRVIAEKSGTYVEAQSCCDSTEKFAKGKPEAAIVAMAQTRAYNRAISDLVGGGESSYEEEQAQQRANFDEKGGVLHVNNPSDSSSKNVKLQCKICNKVINENVANYSLAHHGAELCIKCQDVEKAHKRNK